MIRTNPYFERDRQKIISILEKKYREKKRNFIFKARHIAKQIGSTSQMSASLLETISMVERKEKSGGVFVYITKFG